MHIFIINRSFCRILVLPQVKSNPSLTLTCSHWTLLARVARNPGSFFDACAFQSMTRNGISENLSHRMINESRLVFQKTEMFGFSLKDVVNLKSFLHFLNFLSDLGKFLTEATSFFSPFSQKRFSPWNSYLVDDFFRVCPNVNQM